MPTVLTLPKLKVSLGLDCCKSILVKSKFWSFGLTKNQIDKHAKVDSGYAHSFPILIERQYIVKYCQVIHQVIVLPLILFLCPDTGPL